MNRQLNRILDANFNRTKEGLRVCEDIARFIWDDALLAKKIKALRHQITPLLLKLGFKEVVLARDIQGDVGRVTLAMEKRRADMADVFFANCQRAKESLRVLEEISKLSSPVVSQAFKTIRYKTYAIEHKALKYR